MSETATKTRVDFLRELVDMVGDEDIEIWMSEKNSAFGNLTPNEMFESGDTDPLWIMLEEFRADLGSSIKSTVKEELTTSTGEPIPNTKHVIKEVHRSSYNNDLNVENKIPQVDIFDKIKATFLSVVSVFLFLSFLVFIPILALISINTLFKTNIGIELKTISSMLFLILLFFITTRRMD